MQFLPVIFLMLIACPAYADTTGQRWSVDAKSGYGRTAYGDAEEVRNYATSMGGISASFKLTPKNSLSLFMEGGSLERLNVDEFKPEILDYFQIGFGYRTVLMSRFYLGAGYSLGEVQLFSNNRQVQLVSGYQRAHVNAGFSILKGRHLVKALNLTNEVAILRIHDSLNELNFKKAAVQNIVSLELVLTPADSKWTYYIPADCDEYCFYFNAIQFMIDIPTDLFAMAWKAI